MGARCRFTRGHARHGGDGRSSIDATSAGYPGLYPRGHGASRLAPAIPLYRRRRAAAEALVYGHCARGRAADAVMIAAAEGPRRASVA